MRFMDNRRKISLEGNYPVRPLRFAPLGGYRCFGGGNFDPIINVCKGVAPWKLQLDARSPYTAGNLKMAPARRLPPRAESSTRGGFSRKKRGASVTSRGSGFSYNKIPKAEIGNARRWREFPDFWKLKLDNGFIRFAGIRVTKSPFGRYWGPSSVEIPPNHRSSKRNNAPPITYRWITH